MNYIFISPNYPAGHSRYVTALAAAGHTVLGVGDAGEETFAPELRGALKGYYRVGDLHDYDSVYRACRYFEWQFGRIEAVESLNPYWCDLVSALSGEIITTPADTESEYSRLVSARAEVQALTPRMLGSSAKKVCAFAAETGYPLLAVPAGNKRLGSRLIASDAGVRSLLRGSTKGKYLFAAAGEGEALSVDGLMLKGELALCAAHSKNEEERWVVSVPVEGLESRCRDAALQSGVSCGFFHIDAVRLAASGPLGKKGEVCLVNLEPVPPHEYIVDLLDAEFGCDLRASWAAGEMVLTGGEPCENWSERADGSAEEQPDAQPCPAATPVLPLERRCLAAAATRSFERSYRNLHEKVLHRLGTALTAHGRTQEPDRWEYSDYIYIFTAESPAELKRSIRYITEDHPLPPQEEKPEKTAAQKSGKK